MLLDIVPANNEAYIKHTCYIKRTSNNGVKMSLFIPLDQNLSYVSPYIEMCADLSARVSDGLRHIRKALKRGIQFIIESKSQVTKDSFLYRFSDITYMFEIEVTLNGDGTVRKVRGNQLRYDSCEGFVLELKKVVSPVKKEFEEVINGVLEKIV